MTLKDFKNLYFIGIGGISMSALAKILHSEGYNISGSDIKTSKITEMLLEKNIKVYIGQKQENITSKIDLVIYTSAIKDDNPEFVKTKELNIPCIERSQLIGEMMKEYEKSISIAGTHGKTTTTSMVSEVFIEAQKDPTIMIGGILPSINGNFKIGKKEYFIVESCEYCDSFLNFKPHSSIILNIDKDHTDYFKTLDDIYNSFKKFANLTPKTGAIIVNKDIPNFNKITDGLDCNIITYGKNDYSDWYPKNINFNEMGYGTYDLFNNGKKIIEINLNVPGLHNILNSIAVFALCHFYEIDKYAIKKGLFNFKGTHRRFEFKGEFNGVTVIDDYAHHPTEIKATLKGAKARKINKLWCLFQPHTYTRTKALLDEFSESFDLADEIIIVDIYSAREKDTGKIHSKDLVSKISKRGKSVIYKENFEEAKNYLLQNCNNGDMLITLGAGDINIVGEMLVK